jgi:hypothetical protein
MSAAAAVGLVLSNLFLGPAIGYAWVRRLAVETAVLIAVFVASTTFHTCQVGWFCWGVTLPALQLTDHFTVYAAIVYFSLYFVGTRQRERTAVTVAVIPVLLPVIASYLDSIVSGVVVIAIAAVVALVAAVVILWSQGVIFMDARSVLVAVVLLAAGVVFHVVGGDFGEDSDYPWAHTAWHVLAMLALLFVLDIPYEETSVLKIWRAFRLKYVDGEPYNRRTLADAGGRSAALVGGSDDDPLFPGVPHKWKRHRRASRRTYDARRSRRKTRHASPGLASMIPLSLDV